MVYISIADAQAWAEVTKLPITEIDAPLEETIGVQTLAKLAGSFDTTPWVDSTTTPRLVRKIVAILYVAWFISRAYSSDEGMNYYANRLIAMGNDLIDGLIAGSITLDDDNNPANAAEGTAQFYPTDASSALEPTFQDRSLGGPAFTMGVIW